MADYGTLLRDHVALKCRSIDRVFLQAYQPKLMTEGLVCRYLVHEKGAKIPSSAVFGKIGRAYVESINQFAKQNSIPVVRFAKGENKEETARPFIEAAAQEGGDGRVVMIGFAQEKARVWRSKKARGQEKAAHPHMSWWLEYAYINHYYFYLWDSEWGGAFWKTNAYAPFPIWLWLNGHEWAKRQLEKAGVSYEALDNGFRCCDDPELLQKICDGLGAGAVQSFFQRWSRRLPSPSPSQTSEPATSTTLRSVSLRSLTPWYSIVLKRAEHGSKVSSETTSTLGAQTRSLSSSTDA